MTTADDFRLLGFTDADRADTERMVVDEQEVARFAATLRARIGTFPSAPRDEEMPTDPLVSLAGFLQTLPDLRRFHRERGVPDEISRATLADLGRHLALHRRTHGEFGLETHWWLTAAWSGGLYHLGRLHFLLQQPREPVPGVEHGEWVIDVHIPETGPLRPDVVDASFEQARRFFATHFPERPARTATLTSWLLDPYLLDNVGPESNIARFGRRFTPYGTPWDDNGSTVYFVFSTRDLDDLDRLPRNTALQRLVLDRIAAGGHWQVAHGYMPFR